MFSAPAAFFEEEAMKKLITAAMVFALGACAQAEQDSAPAEADSLAAVPVGPGTRPSAIVPPDTPGSAADTGRVDGER